MEDPLNEIEKRVRVFYARHSVGAMEHLRHGNDPEFYISLRKMAARAIAESLLEQASVYSASESPWPGGISHVWRVSVVMPEGGETDFTRQLDEAGMKGRRDGIEAAANLLSAMGHDSLADSVRKIP